MEPFPGKMVKVGSVYTIYTKHPGPTSQTLDYDKNNVPPISVGTEKSTLIFNPKPWLNHIFILRRGGVGGQIYYSHQS